MKKQVITKHEPIKTLKVFTKHDTVFTKKESEEWSPVPFQWVPIKA